MKTNKFVEELLNKTEAELAKDLVDAKKRTFQFEIPERNKPVGQYS